MIINLKNTRKPIQTNTHKANINKQQYYNKDTIKIKQKQKETKTKRNKNKQINNPNILSS